jgi:hydrogenase/urease accessory protein HupE
MIRQQGGAGAFMRGRRLLARTVAIATLAFAAQAMAPTAAWAHDVPNEIIVRGFAKPNEERLDVALRVPLILLSQLDLPKRGPGYLDLKRIDPSLDRAGEKVASELLRFYEGSDLLRPTAIEHRISLPSEDAFDAYDQAISHIRSGDLPSGADVFWNQGFFDVHLSFPTEAADADLYVDPITPPGVGNNMEVLLQFVSPDDSIRTYRLSGDADTVALDPSWFQAARTFVESGVVHILGGLDHLLFLLCLVLPVRDLRRLLPVVTSFTVAHSIALIASAQGLVPSGEWFPPLVEAVIAASIVYMAVENVVAPNFRRRWIVTGIFGIVHGFGFSYGLQQDFQLAGDHLLTSLLSFNVGVEIGQVIVLAITVPLLWLLLRAPVLQRFGVLVASVAIGHTGYHWMTDRLAVLPSLEWPPLTETTVAALARTLVLLMLVGAAIHVLARRRQRPTGERPVEAIPRTESRSGVMQRV